MMTEPLVSFKFNDIELAFEFASMIDGEPEVYLCLDSGAILYFSDCDESDEPPEDLDSSDRYLAVPTKYDLDLGSVVVFDFVKTHASHLYDEVSDIFSRRGAYGKFKTLLCRQGLVDLWHAFENDRQVSEIRDWCSEHGVVLDDDRSHTRT